jgi:hypothetical protein
MDADRFDALVRSLPAVPRRTALGGVLGAGLAALLTQLETDDAVAKREEKETQETKEVQRRHEKVRQEMHPGD